jgi:formamidopyrimidine-DNA glycosylase
MMVMPELPEVEVIAQQLQRKVKGDRLLRMIVYDPSIWERDSLPPSFIKGSRVVRVFRRGKYLVLSGERGDLILHLRMTGRLVEVERKREGLHPRLVLVFSSGKLAFSDTRRLGKIRIVPSALDWFQQKELGPEPIPFRRKALNALIHSAGKTRRPMKSLLLDQRVLAGLGNIYADESLHRAGIHPRTPAMDLTRERVSALYRAIVEVLYEAILKGGTSIRDYLDLQGERGGFQSFLKVYGREGETCLSCGRGKIERIVLSGRSSFFCPLCQEPP